MDDAKGAPKFYVDEIRRAERRGEKGITATLFIPDDNYLVQEMAVKALVRSQTQDIGENVPVLKKDEGT